MSSAHISVAQPAWSWRRASVPLAVVGAVVGLAVVGWISTPEFVTYRNFQSIVRSAALIGIIAVTMTGITMAGSFFSLSVSQAAAMAAIGFAAFMSWGWPVWAAVLVTFTIAAAVGAVQGGAVALGGNPIVVTLAVGAVLFGLGAWLTDNKTIRPGTDAADWIGTSRPLGVPTQTWAFVVITVLAVTVLARTRFGRELTLVGANRLAAAASGLRPGRTTVYVFVVSSLGAALAGIFTSAQFGQDDSISSTAPTSIPSLPSSWAEPPSRAERAPRRGLLSERCSSLACRTSWSCAASVSGFESCLSGWPSWSA